MKTPMMRMVISMIVALLGACLTVFSQEQTITATGKLTRVAAIGGESTGWAVQLDSALKVGEQQIITLEINSHESKKLEALVNQRVQVKGKLSRRSGVETGNRLVLNVLSLQPLKVEPSSLDLTGSEWVLEDLGGRGIIDNVGATLAFPETGKVAGQGSCNRFFGTAEIGKEILKLGPLGTTRMACSPAVMDQETKYLNALAGAERFQRKGNSLLLYCRGLEKPLRFMRKEMPNTSSRNLTPLFGRIWQMTDAAVKSAPGSIYVFLENGTLLETSCAETYRIAGWSADKQKPSLLRVTEDGRLAFTAEIAELTDAALRLRQTLLRSNETRDVVLKAVNGEFTCPDLPR